MESQFTLVFITSFLSLVHGYTPTFRNEATHPLKAPTESTLQMNEESSGRTNSNIQKHDTYFSGGKHFEYMLLNGSNVLLTSLQNDGPFDGPAEQVVSPKPEMFTRPDFTKNNSSVENTSRNKTYVVTKPLNSSSSWNKTIPVRNNFTAITKLKRNHNSTWYSVKTGPIPEPNLWARSPDFRKFEKPNISSPTRLYSKYENKSNENFASFTSPVVAKPVVSIYSDGSVPETEEKPAHKQSYDYDDSFTKLLISNGILKPDNKEGWRSVVDSSSSTSSPSTEKLYSKLPKKFTAGNTITNMPNNSFSSSYTQILKDRRPVVEADTISSSQNVTKAPENTWNENNVTHLPISSHNQESSTKDQAVDSIQAGIPNQHELSTKSTAGITSNSVGDLNVDESPREASAESNTLSIITSNKSRVYNDKQTKPRENYQPPKKYTLPIVKKNFFPDTMIFNDLVQNENSAKPFNAKNLTRDKPVKISVKSYSNKVEDLSNENYPVLTKFYQISSSKVIDDKIDKNSQEDPQNKTATEFKNLVEKSLQQLFLPVAKFFSNYKENLLGNTHLDDKVKNFKLNIDDSKDVKVTLKSFTFTNLVDVLKNKSKNHKPNEPLLRVDRDLIDNESRDSIFNWTDLNNGENINLEDSINELFSEDDYVHWFVLLLAGNSTIAEMRKEDFVKYLKVNLAARLSLEYNDIKINAILVVPPNLMVNVSLPTNESSVNVNEEVNIEDNQKIGSIHELAETNATLLELSGQEYHVVQLLCLKSQQSVQNSLPQTARVIDRKHDDIEFYIFLIVGAICMFGVISPILYTLYKLIQKRLTTYTFKIPDIFREKIKPPPHEKINESTCESLNVIFSEDFDRKYSSTSWFDNTQHSSSILKPSSEVPPAFFVPKDESFTDFCDITRNPIENSPRLSKENKLNMLGCRPSCVLLPHQGRYQIDSEYDPDKYFDNPNYSHDAR